METKKILDKNGLEYYTGKIKQQIPKKTSQLTNDSGFVLKSVNDLTNYYNKSNTYNKAENMCFISVSLYSASCLAPKAPLL